MTSYFVIKDDRGWLSGFTMLGPIFTPYSVEAWRFSFQKQALDTLDTHREAFANARIVRLDRIAA